jgi:hypothetical protein
MPKAQAVVEPPKASSNTVAVQQDWENREFMQSVQLGLAQLASFLNDFGETPCCAPTACVHRAVSIMPMCVGRLRACCTSCIPQMQQRAENYQRSTANLPSSSGAWSLWREYYSQSIRAHEVHNNRYTMVMRREIAERLHDRLPLVLDLGSALPGRCRNCRNPHSRQKTKRAEALCVMARKDYVYPTDLAGHALEPTR